MAQQDTGDRYKWFVLTMLTIVYIFNFIDRQILVILSEPLKADLNLSDAQLGMLTGLAFAALYVTLGIPIARYADMRNRKNIVALSLAFWSLMTAISGRVVNFTQLFVARIGVGVGEAGGSPPAHSIISDYFPQEKRATALSIYSTGIYIGVLLGYVVGGIIAKHYGWRMAFYAIGIPGVIFAAILYATVREPLKGQNDPGGVVKENPSMKEVMRVLWTKKTFWFLALASGFHTFGTYGVGNFLPPFFQRVHSLDIASVGIGLGLATGLGGAIGTYLGGFISDRLQHRDKRWYIWVPILAGLVNVVPNLVLFFANDADLALGSSFFTSALSAFFLGPTLAVTHSLVNARMRAFASAILFFILNLIGMGLGPLTIGAVSDWLMPAYGDHSLRWAFCVVFVTSAISMVFAWLGSRTYVQDLEKG